MKKLAYSCCLVICFVLWANFGTRGTQEPEKPAINFYGVLIDGRDMRHDVENVTVSGLYQQIPVYSVPVNKDQDPTGDTTFLDLKEIAEIRSVSLDSRRSVKTYRNFDYVEIIVVPRGETKKGEPKVLRYLVDRSRRIMCDAQTVAGPLEKEVAFDAFKSLRINGFLHKDRVQKKEKVQKPSAAQQALCIDIQDALNRLDKNSGRLKDEQLREDMQKDLALLRKSTDALCSVY